VASRPRGEVGHGDGVVAPLHHLQPSQERGVVGGGRQLANPAADPGHQPPADDDGRRQEAPGFSAQADHVVKGEDLARLHQGAVQEGGTQPDVGRPVDVIGIEAGGEGAEASPGRQGLQSFRGHLSPGGDHGQLNPEGPGTGPQAAEGRLHPADRLVQVQPPAGLVGDHPALGIEPGGDGIHPDGAGHPLPQPAADPPRLQRDHGEVGTLRPGGAAARARVATQSTRRATSAP